MKHCAGTRPLSHPYLSPSVQSHDGRTDFALVQQGRPTQRPGRAIRILARGAVSDVAQDAASLMSTCIASSSMQVGSMWSQKPCLWLWSCESVDFACFTLASRRTVTLRSYTQMQHPCYIYEFFASRRVAVTAPSGVLDVHVYGGVDCATVRVSRGSVTLSSYTQTQRSC